MNRSVIILVLVFVSGALYGQQTVVSKGVTEIGKAIYTQRCITCHQVDGTGALNMIPPLIRNDYVLGDKAQMIKILLNGMSGQINVNGDIYEGEMPSHKDLTDAEIAAVLTYVRSNFANNGSAVDAAEVKKVRDEAIK